MADARYQTNAESEYTEVLDVLQRDSSFASWDCPFCGRTPHDTILPGHLGMTEIMVVAKQLFEENVELACMTNEAWLKINSHSPDEFTSDFLDGNLTLAAIHETQGLLCKIEDCLELCMMGSLALMLNSQGDHSRVNIPEDCDFLIKALNEAAVSLIHLQEEVSELRNLFRLLETSKNKESMPSTDVLHLDKLTLNT